MDDTRHAIHAGGHRDFVGGDGPFWDAIGDLQQAFLIGQGLSPSSTLIDVACGSLRGGSRFIRYLDPDRYLGLDKHIELIIYGISQELGLEMFRDKRPEFVVSDTFEFQKFSHKPAFGIAQSLFTHLTLTDAEACLAKLRRWVEPGCRFFVTFFETQEAVVSHGASHSHVNFDYTRSEMETIGTQTGWNPRYIGDWRHPRGQMMIEYLAV